MNYAILAITTLTCLIATGCGRGTNGVKAVKNVVQAPTLLGTFKSHCASVDLDRVAKFLDGSYQESLVFKGSLFTKRQTFYTEENCQGPGLEIRYEGSFSVDASAIEGPGGTIDIETNKLLLVPKSKDIADTMNTINFCGYNNYEVDKTTEIQDFDGVCPLEEVPKTYYGAYQLKDGSLYLDHSDIFEMATAADERNAQVAKKPEFKKD